MMRYSVQLIIYEAGLKMYEDFSSIINDIYNVILQPIENGYKIYCINKFKKKLGINGKELFSTFYQTKFCREKKNGVIYTPYDISKFIVELSVKKEDIIKNPWIRILDPACGCGNIILQAFFYLKNLFKENLKEINQYNNLELEPEDISKHIICHNLFGYDIDDLCLKILIIDLFSEGEYYKSDNFIKEDFLFASGKDFDIVIGNPPYIGHKKIDSSYKAFLKLNFTEVYKDKGDMSYCFIKKSLDCLKENGRLTFIISRYFFEAQNGELLRQFIKENTYIENIIDFYGIRPFSKIGIDPAIISIKKEKKYNNEVSIVRPNQYYRENSKKIPFIHMVSQSKSKYLKSFKIDQYDLDSKGWVLIDDVEKSIVSKIESKCMLNLENICESYQGIITGCDKAFVVDEETIQKEYLERDIIKPWIKSSNIKKYNVCRENKYIIYSNLINQESEYEGCINHIKKFKDKLMTRRECANGARKWYELQWGRKQDIFEKKKMIFPFKSNHNIFAIDEGSYFSADVYSLIIKEDKFISYDFLIKILNSKLYEFYYKTYSKKLGEDLYEYYPNNVMKMLVPEMEFDASDDIHVYNFFELDDSEVKYIEDNIRY